MRRSNPFLNDVSLTESSLPGKPACQITIQARCPKEKGLR